MTDYDQAVIEAMALAMAKEWPAEDFVGAMAQAAWTAAKTALAEQSMRIVYRTAHLGPVVDVTTQEAALTELQRLGQEMEGKLDD